MNGFYTESYEGALPARLEPRLRRFLLAQGLQ